MAHRARKQIAMVALIVLFGVIGPARTAWARYPRLTAPVTKALRLALAVLQTGLTLDLPLGVMHFSVVILARWS